MEKQRKVVAVKSCRKMEDVLQEVFAIRYSVEDYEKWLKIIGGFYVYFE